MNSNIFNLYATSTGGADLAGGGSTFTIVWLVIMVALFYFMLIRPQKKKEKADRQLRASLQAGDKIVTIGGVIGVVVNVKDDRVVMETGADQVRIELAKWAISSNETAAEAAQAKAKKDAEAKAKAKAAKKAEKSK